MPRYKKVVSSQSFELQPEVCSFPSPTPRHLFSLLRGQFFLETAITVISTRDKRAKFVHTRETWRTRAERGLGTSR